LPHDLFQKVYNFPADHTVEWPGWNLRRSVEVGFLERFPITWDHVIEPETLRLKELEHVKTENVEELFGF